MRPIRRGEAVRACVIVLTMTVAATLLALGGSRLGIGSDSAIMLFLLCVLVSAMLTHRYVFGILSAALNALSFNYFFTRPTMSLLMISTSDIVLVVFFLLTGIVGSAIMSELRRQMRVAARNEATARMLHEVSSGFLQVAGRRNIVMNGIGYVKQHCGCLACVTIDGDEQVYGACAESGDPVASYPIRSSARGLGVLRVECPDADARKEHELFFRTLAAQIGIALDRDDLYNERENIRIAMERERSRSTFLRAIAHDLRTPLTSLNGASTLLADQFDRLSAEEKRKLASDISEETVWLTNLVENVLNMTRISESRLDIHMDYEVIDDVVGEAIKRMARLWGGRKFSASYPEEVVALKLDGRLIAQALINLLDNAIKHTLPGDEIRLDVRIEPGQAVFTVVDTGEGIPDAMKPHIFDPYFTTKGAATDSRRGIGLGLPICMAILLAHKGALRVEDNQPRGAKFTFTLPMEG